MLQSENSHPVLLSKKISIDYLFTWCSPFIYLLYDNDKVVYVGKTNKGLGRLLNHHKNNDKKFTHFEIIPCNVDALSKKEASLIGEYNPIYNDVFPKNDTWITFKEARRLVLTAWNNPRMCNDITKSLLNGEVKTIERFVNYGVVGHKMTFFYNKVDLARKIKTNKNLTAKQIVEFSR